MIKTVKDLVEKLSQFDPGAQLDVYTSWYDRRNYNCAHRDIWKYGNRGIELYVCEEEPGIIKIANMNEEDVYMYED